MVMLTQTNLFNLISQQINIQNYLGSKLYDKSTTIIENGDIDTAPFADYKLLLNEYVQPMLIWFAQVDYLPFAAYQVKNGGVFKHTSENAETVNKTEVDYLVEKARTHAEWYARRFIDYMCFNQSKFPEYTTNTNDDIYPSYDATFNGWVL